MYGATRSVTHPKTVARFKERVREITRRIRRVNLHVVIADLNQFIRGWLPCYGRGLSQHLKRALNRWIIRRFKAWLLKQWRKPKTKIKHLVRLGLDREEAVKLGNSRRATWPLSGDCGRGNGRLHRTNPSRGVAVTTPSSSLTSHGYDQSAHRHASEPEIGGDTDIQSDTRCVLFPQGTVEHDTCIMNAIMYAIDLMLLMSNATVHARLLAVACNGLKALILKSLADTSPSH